MQNSRSVRSALVLVFITMVILCMGIKLSLAEENKIDLNALTQETQKVSKESNQMTMLWWIPEEFWRANFSQNPDITEAQIDEFIGALRPYTVIVVVDGSIGSLGTITYKSEEDVRSVIQIADNQGASYKPLVEDAIDNNAKNILLMMKPVFSNMLGPMGQNMHFFLFPAKDANGNSIAEAAKEGSFTVKLGEKEFKWKLPLNSLLPLKVCPTCGENLNGTYNFCPWDGTKL